MTFVWIYLMTTSNYFHYRFINSLLFFSLVFSQGDYIKHPVLYELSHKYGFTDNLPESALPNRLEEIKEAIRREIRKELKVRMSNVMHFFLRPFPHHPHSPNKHHFSANENQKCNVIFVFFSRVRSHRIDQRRCRKVARSNNRSTFTQWCCFDR